MKKHLEVGQMICCFHICIDSIVHHLFHMVSDSLKHMSPPIL